MHDIIQLQGIIKNKKRIEERCDKFSGLVAGLSGRRRPPRPSCLVKYNNILLPINAVIFHIGHLCLLCRPHDGSARSALLGK